MKDHRDHQPDPFETLSKHVPFSSTDSVEADPTLFEEIIMTTQPSPARRARGTRRLVSYAAAAVAVGIVGAGAIAVLSDSSSASADMIAAADATAAIDSGHIVVDIDVRSDVTERGEDQGQFHFDVTYYGEDQRVVFDGGPVAAEADAASSEARFVNGMLYQNMGDSTWIELPVQESADHLSWLGSRSSDAVLDVLKVAENVAETSSAGGVVVYRGTVTAAALEGMSASELPPGIAMVAAEPGYLPAESRLTVEVVDDVVQVVTLDVVGDYPGNQTSPAGRIDATITTSFDQLGEVGPIEAPPADSINATPYLSPEYLAAAEVIDEFYASHPDACADAAIGDDVDEPTPAEIAAFEAALGACLADEGGPEVAAAWETVTKALTEELTENP